MLVSRISVSFACDVSVLLRDNRNVLKAHVKCGERKKKDSGSRKGKKRDALVPCLCPCAGRLVGLHTRMLNVLLEWNGYQINIQPINTYSCGCLYN